jgi:hypothetical protein
MAEVVLLIALLVQEVSDNGGGLLHHLGKVLRPAAALATDISAGHPSSVTPSMAWDMVNSKLTGNFTVDDWVAGLMQRTRQCSYGPSSHSFSDLPWFS